MRCSSTQHTKIWKLANNTPCSHRIASGALSMGPQAKVRLSSVDLVWEEELHSIWGPLAGFSWSCALAKWAHEMTPYMLYHPHPSLIYPT